MANPIIVPGRRLLGPLMEALGITGPVRRIVLDVPADGLARVYVEKDVRQGDGGAVVEDVVRAVKHAGLKDVTPRAVEDLKVELKGPSPEVNFRKD